MAGPTRCGRTCGQYVFSAAKIHTCNGGCLPLPSAEGGEGDTLNTYSGAMLLVLIIRPNKS
jgi:hypothetical protein